MTAFQGDGAELILHLLQLFWRQRRDRDDTRAAHTLQIHPPCESDDSETVQFASGFAPSATPST
jgi:hypothetical protein